MSKIHSSPVVQPRRMIKSFFKALLQYLAEELSRYLPITPEATRSSHNTSSHDSPCAIPGAWPEMYHDLASADIPAQTSTLTFDDTLHDEILASIARNIPGAWPTDCVQASSGQIWTSCVRQTTTECGRRVGSGQWGEWQQRTRLENGDSLGATEFSPILPRITPIGESSGTCLLAETSQNSAYSTFSAPESTTSSASNTGSEDTNDRQFGRSEISMTSSSVTSPSYACYDLRTASSTPTRAAGGFKKTQEFTAKSRMISQQIQTHLAATCEDTQMPSTTPHLYEGASVLAPSASAAEHSQETKVRKVKAGDIMSRKSWPILDKNRQIENWAADVPNEDVHHLTETDVFARRDRIPRGSLLSTSIHGKQSTRKTGAADEYDRCVGHEASALAAKIAASARAVDNVVSSFRENKNDEALRSRKEAWRLQPKRLSW